MTIDYQKLWRAERARADELEEELRQARVGQVTTDRIPVHLSGSQRAIMDALLAARPDSVLTTQTLADIIPRTWRRSNDYNLELLRVQLVRLRKRLRPIGVTVETVWGVGYTLPRSSREAWQRAVDAME